MPETRLVYDQPELDEKLDGVIAEDFGSKFQYQLYKGQDISWKAMMLQPAQEINMRTFTAQPVSPRESLISRLLDRLPESVFLELMILSGYSGKTYSDLLQEESGTWDRMVSVVRSDDRIIVPSDTLGQIRTYGIDFVSGPGSIRFFTSRLRNGGLFPDEWDLLNTMSMGIFGPQPLNWLMRLREWWLSWWPWAKKTPSGDLATQHKQLLLGLRVDTTWKGNSLVHTELFADSDTELLIRMENLPPGLSLLDVLHQHETYLDLAWNQRKKWIEAFGWVIDLITDFILMGPIGLILAGLRLILKGLTAVSQEKRLKGHLAPALPAVVPTA